MECALLALPAEIIDQILTCLSPLELVDASQTCRLLHKHASKDNLWQSFVRSNVFTDLPTPSPATSFRQLYTSHHPHWFLARHKIWFADTSPHGKLLVARYDRRHGSIEAYAVVAKRGERHWGLLDWNYPGGKLEYSTFNPKVQLDLNQPVLHLKLEDRSSAPRHGHRLQSEIGMDVHASNANNHITSTFILARPLPQHLVNTATSLWPPLTVTTPNNQRTRNRSDSNFHSLGHKPATLSETSDATFRVRQYVEFSHYLTTIFGGGSRVGETVTTYGTLTPESYTPTKDKPWQGIWVGDYSVHGCEFLLVTQPDDPKRLPEKAEAAFRNWPRPRAGNVGDVDSTLDDEEPLHAQAQVSPTSATAARRFLGRRESSPHELESDVYPWRGRLEAIKLTGDPHVPRGEITFLVEDLGVRGLVGFAQEPIFNDGAGLDAAPEDSFEGPSLSTVESATTSDSRGARIVKSVGHIAESGFTSDAYIPSQLIMISHRRLAQYWQPFGHVSFYERVDLEALMKS